MRVKKLIEWLSEDFQPDDIIFVQVWGRDLFTTSQDHPDTDDQPPSEQVWRNAVEATENSRQLELITEWVYDVIDENIAREEKEENK